MLRQMRLLYYSSNRLTTMSKKCSQSVIFELCRNFCTPFLVLVFRLNTKKNTSSKLRVACNNVNRKVFGLKRRSSVSEMFVLNNNSKC